MNARLNTDRSAKSRALANMNTVDAYVWQSLAPNTVAADESDLRHFRAWGGRVPATPQMVARYMVEHAGQVKASTLSRRMAAIASAHAQASRPSPAQSEQVQSTLRGIRRVHGTAQRQAKPISIEMLRQMAKSRKDIEPMRDLRDRVLLVVGFAGGFRRSELAQLTPQSFIFRAQGVEVTLQRSKTDQQGKGRVVALPPGPRHLCPVQLLKAWLLVLRRTDPEGAAQPLFRRVDRYGQIGQGLRGAAVGGSCGNGCTCAGSRRRGTRRTAYALGW